MPGPRLLLALCFVAACLLAADSRTASPSTAATRVELVATGDMARAEALVRSLGGTVEVVAHGRIQALVPERAMPVLTTSRDVVEVARPGLFVPLQVSASTEIIGSDRWNAAGFTGYGSSVAILDSGFRGYPDALGDTLPEDVTVRSFRADGNALGSTDHGRRAAEIVHEVAPGAHLYLVNFSTVTELSQAVDYLIQQRVDIVSFSLGYIHNGPGDGTGPVNEIVTRATDAGIAWAVSAGNFAQQHWAGARRDNDGDGILEFANGVELNQHAFTAGDLITISLRWDEPWGAACSDFDIEVFGPTGALVRASRDVQSCAQDPVESLQVLATQTGLYGVRIIEAHADAGRRLDLLVVGSPDRGNVLTVSTLAGSLSEPADHPAVVTVGALTGSTLREAFFSSRGPTTDGRAKPGILAPTGSENASPTGTFGGTSAAAPHVAGAMALLREAYPGASAELLRTLITSRAEEATPLTGGSGAPRLDMGSLAGLGPLLPAGAEDAQMLGGEPPSGEGLALLQYDGPDGYPARFAHLLFERGGVSAVYSLDIVEQRWHAYIFGAPAFVNRSLTEFDDGDLLVVRFRAPA